MATRDGDYWPLFGDAYCTNHAFPTRELAALEAWKQAHKKLNDSMDSIRRFAATQPAEPVAQPADSGRVWDISRLTRYFPSMPSHPGWQMTPDSCGEWVMFRDVQALAAPSAQGQSPASPAGVPEEWITSPDSIPQPIIQACRDAICREFGNNGTDGYYKRILAAIFKAIAAAPSAPEGADHG
jgi:hypothetical protein